MCYLRGLFKPCVCTTKRKTQNRSLFHEYKLKILHNVHKFVHTPALLTRTARLPKCATTSVTTLATALFFPKGIKKKSEEYIKFILWVVLFRVNVQTEKKTVKTGRTSEMGLSTSVVGNVCWKSIGSASRRSNFGHQGGKLLIPPRGHCHERSFAGKQQSRCSTDATRHEQRGKNDGLEVDSHLSVMGLLFVLDFFERDILSACCAELETNVLRSKIISLTCLRR
jgi:hypothetical protein